jgi:hypothetical protein
LRSPDEFALPLDCKNKHADFGAPQLFVPVAVIFAQAATRARSSGYRRSCDSRTCPQPDRRIRQLGESWSVRNKSAFIDGMPATEDPIPQNPMDKHSKKTKVMLQDADNTAALSVAANPRVDEAKEVSVASFSAPVIDFFDACDQRPGPHNASCRKRKDYRKLSI